MRCESGRLPTPQAPARRATTWPLRATGSAPRSRAPRGRETGCRAGRGVTARASFVPCFAYQEAPHYGYSQNASWAGALETGEEEGGPLCQAPFHAYINSIPSPRYLRCAEVRAEHSNRGEGWGGGNERGGARETERRKGRNEGGLHKKGLKDGRPLYM